MNANTLLRRAWIIITNMAMIYMILPRVEATNQLRRSLGEQPISPWSEIGSHPWVLVFIVVLLLGIIADFVSIRMAAVLNIGCYLVALGAALSGIVVDRNEVHAQEIYLGVLLYVIPIFIIATINILIYRKSLRRNPTTFSDAGTPAPVA